MEWVQAADLWAGRAAGVGVGTQTCRNWVLVSSQRGKGVDLGGAARPPTGSYHTPKAAL